MTTNLPTRQREALFLANHGPLGMVKGTKAQATALVKKGLLDSELQPTEAGREAYSEMTRTRTWGEVLDTFGNWRFSATPHYRNPVGYSVAGMITALSADGRTAYLTEHGVTRPTVAIDVEDIPDPFLKFFGLAREPFFHTVVPA